MKKLLIKLDFDSWAGMDDEAATTIKSLTDGEAWCERVTEGKFDGYYLYSENKNALANAYIYICGANDLRDAMEQGDPSHDLSTEALVWAEFSEYYEEVA